MEIKVISALMD